MKNSVTGLFFRTILCCSLLLVAFSVSAQEQHHVIVKTNGARADLIATIQRLGGRVDIRYQNIPAVAATVSPQAMLALRSISELQVFKDLEISIPDPQRFHGQATAQIDTTDAQVVDLANAAGVTPKSPADYSFNNTIIRANVLQDAGDLGQGIVVGVIDAGVANNPTNVSSLAGSVIGGETFIQNDPVASATSTKNGLHGTWVGNMIAAHVIFFFRNTSCLPLAVQANAPDSAIDGSLFGLPGRIGIPIVGVAPAAKLYAFKVFPSNSGSTRSSIVIAAMDRAITHKKNFASGMPVVPVSGSGTDDDPFVFNSLNIQALNLSLGGPDIFAGRNAEAIIDGELLNAGIVVSIAAGNAGPSGGSLQSPGDGLAALSMGATVTPAHDRILDDVIACGSNGPSAIGTGLLAHPTDFDQVVFFSSRGPTSDGRASIGAVTAGTANFAQGADGFLYLVSGTSFAAPTGAGAAALLAAAVPSATAKQIRNAIIGGANDDLLSERTTRFDRGNGYLDLVASLKRLQDLDDVPDSFPVNIFTPSVEVNLIFDGIFPDFLFPGGTVSHGVHALQPGDRKDFFIEIPKNVGSVTFNLTDLDLAPPTEQNALFGDDLIVAVHQAKMTGGTADDYAVPPTVVTGPGSVTIANPEPGFMRATLMGDSTNASSVSARFNVTATLKPRPDFVFTGTITDQDVQLIPFNVPPNLSQAAFELTWNHDWTHYPTNDLDLVLIDPSGNFDFDGATLNGRERAVVKNPAPGQWTLAIVGATVFGQAPQGDGSTPTPPGTDKFKAEVILTH